jgi:hypothetical protein
MFQDICATSDQLQRRHDVRPTEYTGTTRWATDCKNEDDDDFEALLHDFDDHF